MSLSVKNPREFVILPLTFLLIILDLSVCSAQEINGPRMVLEEKVYDAKEVKENAVIEHTFKVLNKGDSLLEIKKVKPG